MYLFMYFEKKMIESILSILCIKYLLNIKNKIKIIWLILIIIAAWKKSSSWDEQFEAFSILDQHLQ